MTAARRHSAAVVLGPLILGSATGLVAAWPRAAGLLEYNRDALLAGEWWRALTGHWSHASLDHLGWDLSVFLILGCCLALRSPRTFWTTLVGSTLAISAALLTLGPQWQAYRGLSGIDTALFVTLAMLSWFDSRRPTERWLAATADSSATATAAPPPAGPLSDSCRAAGRGP